MYNCWNWTFAVQCLGECEFIFLGQRAGSCCIQLQLSGQRHGEDFWCVLDVRGSQCYHSPKLATQFIHWNQWQYQYGDKIQWFTGNHLSISKSTLQGHVHLSFFSIFLFLFVYFLDWESCQSFVELSSRVMPRRENHWCRCHCQCYRQCREVCLCGSHGLFSNNSVSKEWGT